MFLWIDRRWGECYTINKFKSCLRGGVQFPTGGNAAFSRQARERKLIMV